jgi:ribosomal protein L37E
MYQSSTVCSRWGEPAFNVNRIPFKRSRKSTIFWNRLQCVSRADDTLPGTTRNDCRRCDRYTIDAKVGSCYTKDDGQASNIRTDCSILIGHCFDD